MGLDMYAYAIDARLVDDDDEIDVELFSIARRAVGFTDLMDFELKKLDAKGREQYFDKRCEADQKAADEGWIDPKFAYWRKFNALHGWMQQLYYAKGGQGDFNCNTLRLTASDLDNLSDAIENGKLQPTSGFFFGSDEIDADDIKAARWFVHQARAAIANGKAVFYDSWW